MFGGGPVDLSPRRLSNPFVNLVIVLDPATSCYNKFYTWAGGWGRQKQKTIQYNNKKTHLPFVKYACMSWVFLALAHLSLTTAEHRDDTLKEPSTTIPIPVVKFTFLEQVPLRHLKTEWV